MLGSFVIHLNRLEPQAGDFGDTSCQNEEIGPLDSDECCKNQCDEKYSPVCCKQDNESFTCVSTESNCPPPETRVRRRLAEAPTGGGMCVPIVSRVDIAEYHCIFDRFVMLTLLCHFFIAQKSNWTGDEWKV